MNSGSLAAPRNRVATAAGSPVTLWRQGIESPYTDDGDAFIRAIEESSR
jgi:hypothetical protein